MTVDYLWDRSGPPDTEIQALERTLSSVSLGALERRLPAPPEPRSRSVVSYALAAAAALAIGAGAGYWLGRAQGARVSVSPDLPLAAKVAAAAGKQCPPCPKTTTAKKPRRAPAKPAPRKHESHLVDPFSHSAPPAPQQQKSHVVDPWSHGSAKPATKEPGRLVNPWAPDPHKRSSSDVQRVVTAHTGEIRSACWKPALAARPSDAPDTARVSVAIVIAPDGHVQSAKGSGSPRGYPGLDTCIAARARSWRFSKAGAKTTVVVPFVFSAAR